MWLVLYQLLYDELVKLLNARLLEVKGATEIIEMSPKENAIDQKVYSRMLPNAPLVDNPLIRFLIVAGEAGPVVDRR